MFNIKNLKIENKSYSVINSSFEDRLDDLSRVNIFIGANNTGKSRFMRSLFYIDKNIKLNFLPNDDFFDYYLNKLNEFKNFMDDSKNKSIYLNETQAYKNINDALTERDYLVESQEFNSKLTQINKNIDRSGMPHNSYWHFCDKIFKKHFENITFDETLFNYNFYKIYIPSLRGLIPLVSKDDGSNEDVYAKRIKYDYFGEKSNILVDVNDFLLNDDVKSRTAIISGMKFYEYVKNYLLGDLEQREMIRDYEVYLSETFFDNKKVVLIPKINDDVLTVRIDEEEYKIYDLGEGIQSIILITLPLFLYLKKSKEANTNVLVFIEEPDVGLHPRLQRILIETLLDERFDNYQFFLTTHSNHFIDMIVDKNDISVYLFEKQEVNGENSSPLFNIKHVDSEYWNVLEELGALPSSVLMANCTILVEGMTDRCHFQLYLDLYQNQLSPEKPRFRSGIHYSFLIAGGSEYKNTIKRLNNLQKEKLCFICDYDNDQKNIEREDFFEKYPLEYQYTLNCTEVENIVSKAVIINMLKNTYGLKTDDVNEDFNESEYFDSDNFFEFVVGNVILSELPEKFARGKNDLKKPICRSEMYCIHNYDELTDEAKKVAKFIYEFIKKNNY